MILWELPWIGGRARGHQRPRPPSLNERPDGQRRAFGLRGVESEAGDYAGQASEERPPGKDAEAGKENVSPVSEARPHSNGDGGVKHRLPSKA